MKEGKTGYLTDPDDVNSFATKIRKLKSDPQLRVEMGKNSQKAVLPFLLDNSRKEVLNLIKEIAK